MLQEPATLQKSLLFHDLDDLALTRIYQAAQLISRPHGSFFFMEGDPALHTMVVSVGQVKLSQVSEDGQHVILGFIGPYREFGILSAAKAMEYPVSAQAVGDSQAYRWSRQQMANLVKDYPSIRDNIIQIMARQIAEFQSRIRELSTQRVERRIARTVLRLAQQSGVKTQQGVLIDLPLSRQDLAEMTGTTLYTVSRFLKQWEAQGLVLSKREKVIITHPHGLVSIAEDLIADRS